MTRGGGGPKALATAALAVVGVVAHASCQGYLAHTFGGYAYDSIDDCLTASGVIDVIAGADPGECPMLRCWVAPCGGVYVTDEQCDAPPDYQDETNATSGPCVKALALYAQPAHGQCEVVPTDGGLGCGL
jgi:hypothetical protein